MTSFKKEYSLLFVNYIFSIYKTVKSVYTKDVRCQNEIPKIRNGYVYNLYH